MAWSKNNKRQGLKRLIMTSLLMAVICIDVMAGNAGDSTSCAVGRVGADFYVGACVPLGNYHDGEGKLSQLLGINVRYNSCILPALSVIMTIWGRTIRIIALVV